MESLGDYLDVVCADRQVVDGIKSLVGSLAGGRNPGVGVGRGDLRLDNHLAIGIGDGPGDAAAAGTLGMERHAAIEGHRENGQQAGEKGDEALCEKTARKPERQ